MDSLLTLRRLAFAALITITGSAFAQDAATSATLPLANDSATSAIAEIGFPKNAEVPIFAVAKRGSGPPMLLISGQVSDARVWNDSLPYLEKHFTCYTLVPAGFGGLAPIPSPYLEGLKNGLKQFLHDEDLKDVVVVGHSMSGFVSLWLGTEEHERIRAIVSVEGGAYPPALAGASIDMDQQRRKFSEVREAFKTMGADQFHGICLTLLRVSVRTEANRELAMDMAMGTDPPTLGEVNYDLATTDLRPKLDQITVPVLYMGSFGQSRSDETVLTLKNVHMKHFERLRMFKYVQFRDAYHLIMMDDPDRFAQEILDFLADLPKERPIPSPVPTPTPTATPTATPAPSPSGNSAASLSPTPLG